ncbi:tungstate ABC transporter substrate-binding protein WtpA, partial [Candidatus Geothermarchaeota archaeon]
MKRVLVVIAILLVILGGIYYLYSGLENKAIKIFSAGSLSEPLNEFSLLYEDTYGVKVNIEYSGSVDAIRKIIDA